MPSPDDAHVPWNGLNSSASVFSSPRALAAPQPRLRPAPIATASRNVSPIAGALIARRFVTENMMIPRKFDMVVLGSRGDSGPRRTKAGDPNRIGAFRGGACKSLWYDSLFVQPELTDRDVRDVGGLNRSPA